MPKPSKWVAVVVLLASTWLTGYQIGDAAEDNVEDMTTVTQLTSSQQHHWTRTPTPENETDENIPNISDQTLMPAVNLWLSEALTFSFSHSFNAVRVLLALAVALHSLSPPRVFADSDDALALRHLQFAASSRTLAPPRV